MYKKKSNKKGKYTVIVLNDNHNTFEHVTNCLREVCGHNKIQAMQCTNIIHNTGKCSVYTDKYDDCNDVLDELTNKGIVTGKQFVTCSNVL